MFMSDLTQIKLELELVTKFQVHIQIYSARYQLGQELIMRKVRIVRWRLKVGHRLIFLV